MQYIKEGATLPVPFNIIPTPKAFYKFCEKIYSRFKRNKPNLKIELNNLSQMSASGKPSKNVPNGINNKQDCNVIQQKSVLFSLIFFDKIKLLERG